MKIDHEYTNCRVMLQQLSDYLDGELDAELCAALEKHLAECGDCSIVLNTLQKTIDLYKKQNEEETLPGDVRGRLFSRLNLDEFYH